MARPQNPRPQRLTKNILTLTLNLNFQLQILTLLQPLLPTAFLPWANKQSLSAGPLFQPLGRKYFQPQAFNHNHNAKPKRENTHIMRNVSKKEMISIIGGADLPSLPSDYLSDSSQPPQFTMPDNTSMADYLGLGNLDMSQLLWQLYYQLCGCC